MSSVPAAPPPARDRRIFPHNLCLYCGNPAIDNSRRCRAHYNFVEGVLTGHRLPPAFASKEFETIISDEATLNATFKTLRDTQIHHLRLDWAVPPPAADIVRDRSSLQVAFNKVEGNRTIHVLRLEDVVWAAPHIAQTYHVQGDKITARNRLPDEGKAANAVARITSANPNLLSAHNWENYTFVDPMHDDNCGTHLLAELVGKTIRQVNQECKEMFEGYYLPYKSEIDYMMLTNYAANLGMGVLVLTYREGATPDHVPALYSAPAVAENDTLVLLQTKDDNKADHWMAIRANAGGLAMSRAEFDAFYKNLTNAPTPVERDIKEIMKESIIADEELGMKSERAWNRSWNKKGLGNELKFEEVLPVIRHPSGPYEIDFSKMDLSAPQLKLLHQAFEQGRVCAGTFKNDSHKLQEKMKNNRIRIDKEFEAGELIAPQLIQLVGPPTFNRLLNIIANPTNGPFSIDVKHRFSVIQQQQITAAIPMGRVCFSARGWDMRINHAMQINQHKVAATCYDANREIPWITYEQDDTRLSEFHPHHTRADINRWLEGKKQFSAPEGVEIEGFATYIQELVPTITDTDARKLATLEWNKTNFNPRTTKDFALFETLKAHLNAASNYNAEKLMPRVKSFFREDFTTVINNEIQLREAWDKVQNKQYIHHLRLGGVIGGRWQTSPELFDVLVNILQDSTFGPFSTNFGEQSFSDEQITYLTRAFANGRVCFFWFETSQVEWAAICEENQLKLIRTCTKNGMEVPWFTTYHGPTTIEKSEYYPITREAVNSWILKGDRQLAPATKFANHHNPLPPTLPPTNGGGGKAAKAAHTTSSKRKHGKTFKNEDHTLIIVDTGAFKVEDIQRLYTLKKGAHWPGFGYFVEWAKTLRMATMSRPTETITWNNVQSAGSKSRGDKTVLNPRSWIENFVNRSGDQSKGTKWDFILNAATTGMMEDMLNTLESPAYTAIYEWLCNKFKYRAWQFHVTLPDAAGVDQPHHQDYTDGETEYATLIIPLTIDGPNGGGTGFPRVYKTTVEGTTTVRKLADESNADGPVVINPYGGYAWFTGNTVHYGVANRGTEPRVFLCISFFDTKTDPNAPAARNALAARKTVKLGIAFADWTMQGMSQ
jgi:hypothetical protein